MAALSPARKSSLDRVIYLSDSLCPNVTMHFIAPVGVARKKKLGGHSVLLFRLGPVVWNLCKTDEKNFEVGRFSEESI